MLLLLAVGPVLLPEFRDPEAGRLDLPSAALSLAAVLLVIYALKRVAEAWVPVASIVIGLALGVQFVRRQRPLAHPLIDLGLFRVPAFSGSLAIYMLACFVGFGAYVFIAQYLQLVLGLFPLEAGLWTVPSMAAYVVGFMLVPAVARRIQPAYAIATGWSSLLPASACSLRSTRPEALCRSPQGPSSTPWGFVRRSSSPQT